MNLLVKRLGLVFLPALFFACEDPTELGTEINPNTGAVSAHYIEIPLNTSQVVSDSILTSWRVVGAGTPNAALYPSPYIGRVESGDFGILKSSLYANLAKPADSVVFPSNVFGFDSVKFQMIWNNTSVYGKQISSTQRFNVYRLQSPIASTGSRTIVEDEKEIEALSYKYYASDKEPLGEFLGQITLDIPPVFAEQLDTTALNDINTRLISTHLPAEFVASLYERFRTDAKAENYNTGIFSSQEAFNEYIKGIAVVPAENNSFLTSVNLTSVESGLIIYYHQGVNQKSIRLSFQPTSTDTRVYDLSYPVYFGVETDRSGTGLSNEPNTGHLLEFDPVDNRVYFQGMTGLYPKVDLSAFKEFVLGLDADERIMINRAVIEFDSVVGGVGKREPLPESLELYFVESDNRRFFSPTFGGFERALATTGRSYKVGETTVNVVQSDIVYNLEQFMRTGQERYLQALLYPADASSIRPEKFVVRPDQVKLKIWYTKLNGANL